MMSLEEIKARRAELVNANTRDEVKEDKRLERIQRELEVREATRQDTVKAAGGPKQFSPTWPIPPADPVKNAANQVRDLLLEMAPGDRIIVERYPETDGMVIFKTEFRQFAPLIEVD